MYRYIGKVINYCIDTRHSCITNQGGILGTFPFPPSQHYHGGTGYIGWIEAVDIIIEINLAP